MEISAKLSIVQNGLDEGSSFVQNEIGKTKSKCAIVSNGSGKTTTSGKRLSSVEKSSGGATPATVFAAASTRAESSDAEIANAAAACAADRYEQIVQFSIQWQLHEKVKVERDDRKVGHFRILHFFNFRFESIGHFRFCIFSLRFISVGHFRFCIIIDFIQFHL